MVGFSRYMGNRPPIIDAAKTHVMHNRLILPLLCAASVAFAAAPFSHDGKAIASTKHHGEEKIAPIVSTFDITRPKDDAERLRFSLRVTNNTSKMLELRFADGQTHDFVVKDLE